MELYLTLLISLHVTISTRVASGQLPISRSIVCQNTSSSTPCVTFYHSLSCPASRAIFILEVEQGFLFSPSPQSSCTGSVCDQQCCSLNNFLCTAPISNIKFGNYFTDCWGLKQCTTPSSFDTRTLTEGNLNCSGVAALASVSYQGIENSSVVRFDNETTVSGTAVVARYLKTETNSTNCLEPNNTVGCDVTMEGNGSTSDVRVMLVIEHPALDSICSMLSIAEHSFSTGKQSCKQSFVAYAVKNITMSGNTNKLSIVLTLLEAKHPIRAWAVVTSSTTTLQMQCGRGTCKPSAASFGSTQTISTSTLTISTSTPTTQTVSRSISIQTAADPRKTSSSQPTTPLPISTSRGQQPTTPDNQRTSDSSSSSGVPASSSQSDVSPLVAAVVVLSVFCLLLILSLVLVAALCWRRRAVPRDPTYSLPMSHQLEERQYETLHTANQQSPIRETNSVRP